jgi:hypothetical protein
MLLYHSHLKAEFLLECKIPLALLEFDLCGVRNSGAHDRTSLLLDRRVVNPDGAHVNRKIHSESGFQSALQSGAGAQRKTWKKTWTPAIHHGENLDTRYPSREKP